MSEGGAGMRELRRLDSIVSPQARQQAAKAQTDQESNTTKFQALLKYLVCNIFYMKLFLLFAITILFLIIAGPCTGFEFRRMGAMLLR